MLDIPSGEQELIAFANELVKQCTASQSVRNAYYRALSMIYETGRYDGTKALVNTLPNHIKRLAGMLYSPVELKFSVGYRNIYPSKELERGKVAARLLGDEWATPDVNGDTLWGRGTENSLHYGAVLLKQWTTEDWGIPVYEKKLVMPWQFGVFDESENDINKQEALVETSRITLPAVWKRISHLPNANELYKQIEQHAGISPMGDSPDSFFHTVLSTSQLQTGVNGGGSVVPGGIVQFNQNPNYALMGPVVSTPTVKLHEIWVKGKEDYNTIQMIEDVVLVTKFKTSNLLGVARQQPYRLIQPNEVTNYFWGRSELVDLIEPQGLFATWCDDLKRMYGLQVDKILAFTGTGGITDEIYGQFRVSGYLGLDQGADVKDLTPKIPPEALPLLKWIMEVMNMIMGFPPIMQGMGESGVRAGVQLNSLMKTASPTQRDRALLLERQLASAAHLSLSLMRAKDARYYWTNGTSPEEAEATKFLLGELPADFKVGVDSHSASPIFSDENMQLIFQARKIGDVSGRYMIENLPFPNKDQALREYDDRQKASGEERKQVLQKAEQLPAENQAKIIEKMVARR